MPNLAQLEILQTQIAPAAVEAEAETGLPAELSAAQCIFESGWLSRAPGNNAFGIMPDHHGAGVQYFMSQEFLDGSWVQKMEAFERYDSLADCFADHARLITQGAPYAAVWARYQQDKDLHELIESVAPIYATAPYYAAQILEEAYSPFLQSAIAAARAAKLGAPTETA